MSSKFYNRNHLVKRRDGTTKGPLGDTKVKRKTNKGPNEGFKNLMSPILCDPILEAVIGKSVTTRPEAVRLIWNYIKRHNLQKPGHGRIILPDQRLGALTGEPGVEFNGFKLMTHIQRHILPPRPPARPRQ
jgi:chromatin remodeling complex protein RSC6